MDETPQPTIPSRGEDSYKPKVHTPDAKTFLVDVTSAPRVAGGACSDHQPMPDGEDHGFVAMVCPNCHRGFLLRRA